MKHILITLLAAAMLFTGCSTMKEYLLDEEVKTVTVKEDTVMKKDGSLMNADSYEAITGQPAPADKIIKAGETIELITYKPKSEITSGIDLVDDFIPYGELIGGLATLVLGVGAGAVGTKVRKDKQLKDVQSTEDKMNEAFSRTIDDLRDLLDQTEGGEQIDEFLQAALSNHADKLQVAGKVLEFFNKYESPTKPKGGIKLAK